MGLFDFPAENEALAAQHEAIERAVEHANPAWLDFAEQLIRSWPIGREFTTDELWEVLDRAGFTTHEGRALGGVMRRLQMARVIVNTKRYESSRRVENHARPIPVWRRT